MEAGEPACARGPGCISCAARAEEETEAAAHRERSQVRRVAVEEQAAAAELAATQLLRQEAAEARAGQGAKQRGAAKKARQKRRKVPLQLDTRAPVWCFESLACRSCGLCRSACTKHRCCNALCPRPAPADHLQIGQQAVSCHVQAERQDKACLQQDEAGQCPALPCPAQRPAAAFLPDLHDSRQEPLIRAAAEAHCACSSPEDSHVLLDNARSGDDPTIAHADLGAHEGGSSADEVMECVVCWEAAASVVLRPCGHMCTCEACADACLGAEPRLCPLCRTSVMTCIAVAG